jgi:uncharacterized YigZ family protein
MPENYQTVKSFDQHELVIDSSRFIAYVSRTETEDAAHLFIEEIKEKHREASHNCSTYLIGPHDDIQKAHDDGEPSGTAGRSILEVLKKIGFKDTTVVVTRSFGGIKLGASGLIRAYGQAAKKGILSTDVVERCLHQQVYVAIPYHFHGKLTKDLNQQAYTITETAFTEQVTLQVMVKIGEENKLIELITSLTNAQADIHLGEKQYIELPVIINQ